MSNYSSIAIVAGEPKYSALFFDKICPISSREDIPDKIETIKPIISSFRSDEGAYKFAVMVKAEMEGLNSEQINQAIQNYNTLETQLALAKQGIDSVPLFYKSKYFDSYFSNGEISALEIAIKNIPVINPQNLSWEQVIEIRNDADSSRKLRRFRLFLADNYEGKSEQYVRDSLLMLLDDYNASCKKHGLELILSTLKSTLNSKSLLSTLSISAAGLLLGQPSVVAASLLTGSVIEIGKASIAIAEKKVELGFQQSTNEIAYLADICNKG